MYDSINKFKHYESKIYRRRQSPHNMHVGHGDQKKFDWFEFSYRCHKYDVKSNFKHRCVHIEAVYTDKQIPLLGRSLQMCTLGQQDFMHLL